MSTITTGRTLDVGGEPIPGTGFAVDTDSWLATRLRERSGPISSHPTQPVWSVPLGTADEASGAATDDTENPFQRAVIADRLADHTVFTAAEGGLAGVATDLLASVGRAGRLR
ncbi:MAG: hypothetical protein J07HB67_00171 [halophilic archaeon J07HB67]|nr:MAG: hypothetical protein J07HB67_00171 [halophilic archaeon J07HB67]